MSCASQRLRYGRGGMNGEFGRTEQQLSHPKNNRPFFFSNAMAKRKKSRGMRKIAPAITDIQLQNKSYDGTQTHNTWYVDTARELSKINRRLYSQSKMYAYQGLTFIWRADAANDIATIEVAVRTAGNTWIVHNAHVKGHALWNQMQELVLEDNPSLKAKWHDYKVTLATSQTGWTGSGNSLSCRDSAGNLYEEGEWNMSTYVMPQHEVETTGPDAGKPLPADEFDGCLIGGDNVSRRSLVKAYQESRATVSPDQPNTPAGMPDSFFSLLTDSGSQEPELATVIQDENENPPYSLDNYPQGDTNAPVTTTVAYGAISASEVDGRIPGFVAPCGLLEINVRAYDSAGGVVSAANTPVIDMLLHVAPGAYKGVAAIDMGQ